MGIILSRYACEFHTVGWDGLGHDIGLRSAWVGLQKSKTGARSKACRLVSTNADPSAAKLDTIVSSVLHPVFDPWPESGGLHGFYESWYRMQ